MHQLYLEGHSVRNRDREYETILLCTSGCGTTKTRIDFVRSCYRESLSTLSSINVP